jgi:hypothetical protein
MVEIVTPKSLARDLDVRASTVRAMLRERYGLAQGNRWRWDESEARDIRLWLAQLLGKKVDKNE